MEYEIRKKKKILYEKETRTNNGKLRIIDLVDVLSKIGLIVRRRNSQDIGAMRRIIMRRSTQSSS